MGRHSTAATRDEAQSLFNCFLCERSEGRARLGGAAIVPNTRSAKSIMRAVS